MSDLKYPDDLAPLFADYEKTILALHAAGCTIISSVHLPPQPEDAGDETRIDFKAYVQCEPIHILTICTNALLNLSRPLGKSGFYQFATALLIGREAINDVAGLTYEEIATTRTTSAKPH